MSCSVYVLHYVAVLARVKIFELIKSPVQSSVVVEDTNLGHLKEKVLDQVLCPLLGKKTCTIAVVVLETWPWRPSFTIRLA